MEIPVESPAAGNVSGDVAWEDLWSGDGRSSQEIPDNTLIADLFSSDRNGTKQTVSVDSEPHSDCGANSDSSRLIVDTDPEDSSDNSLSLLCQNSVSTKLSGLEAHHQFESKGKRSSIKREAVDVESGTLLALVSSGNAGMHDRMCSGGNSTDSGLLSDDSVVEVGRSERQVYDVDDALSRILRGDMPTNEHFHNVLVDYKRVRVVALDSNQDLEDERFDEFAKENRDLGSKAFVLNDDVFCNSSPLPTVGGSEDDVTILEDDRKKQSVDSLRVTTITLSDVSHIQGERDGTEHSPPTRSAEATLVDLTDVSSSSVEPETDDIAVLYEKFAPKEEQRSNKRNEANGAYVANTERAVTIIETGGELCRKVKRIARSSQTTEDKSSNSIVIISLDSSEDKEDETTAAGVRTNETGQTNQLAVLNNGDSNSDFIKETELEKNKQSPVSVFRINQSISLDQEMKQIDSDAGILTQAGKLVRETIVDAPKTEEVSFSSPDVGEDFLVQILEDLLSEDFEMNDENEREEENDLEAKAVACTFNDGKESTISDFGDKLLYEKMFVEIKAEEYVQDSDLNSDVEGQLIDEDELLQSSECDECTDDIEDLLLDSDDIVDEELTCVADSTIKNDSWVDARDSVEVAELELHASGTYRIDDDEIEDSDNLIDEVLASVADSTIKNDSCVDASDSGKVAKLELHASGTYLIDDDDIEDNFDHVKNLFNSTFKCDPCLDSSVRDEELDVPGIDVGNSHVDDSETAVPVDMVDREPLLLNDADKVEENSQSLGNSQNNIANDEFDEKTSLIFEESFNEFPLSKSLCRLQSQEDETERITGEKRYLYTDSFQSESRKDPKMEAEKVAGNNLKVCNVELMKLRVEVASEDDDYVDLMGDVSALNYFSSSPARLAPPVISLRAGSSSEGEYLDARDRKASSSDGDFYDCCEPHDLTLEQENDLLRSDEESGPAEELNVNDDDDRVFVFTGKKRTLKDCDESSSKKSRWMPNFSVIRSAPTTEAQAIPFPISNAKTDPERTNGSVGKVGDLVQRDVTRDCETAESKASGSNESAPNVGSSVVSKTNNFTIPKVRTNSDSRTCSCPDTMPSFGYFCVRCDLPTKARGDDEYLSSTSRCSSGMDSPDEELDMLFDCNSTLPCTVDMSICSLDQSNVIETETGEFSHTKKLNVNNNNSPDAPSFPDTQNYDLSSNSTATSNQVAKPIKKAFPEAHPDYKSLTLATKNKSIPVALNDVAPSSSRYVDYISPDAAENEDNNSAGWEAFRALQTDEERFLKVRSRWLNATLPDPNRDLTLRHDRFKPDPDNPLLRHPPVIHANATVNSPFQSNNTNPSHTNNKNLVANNDSDFNHNTINYVDRNLSVYPNTGFAFTSGSQNQDRFPSGPACLSPHRPAPADASFHTDQFPSDFSDRSEFYTSPVALPQPTGPPWTAGGSQGIDYRYPMNFNANPPFHQPYTNPHPAYLDSQINPNNPMYHHQNSQLAWSDASYHPFPSPAPSFPCRHLPPASCHDPRPPDAAVERRGVKRALEADEGTECPPLKRARTIPCTKIYDNVLDCAESEQQQKLYAHHSERKHAFEQLGRQHDAEAMAVLRFNTNVHQRCIALQMMRDRQLEDLKVLTAECERREAAIVKQFDNKFACVYSAVEELKAFRSFYQNASSSADSYYMNERELAETKEMYDYYTDMMKFYGSPLS